MLRTASSSVDPEQQCQISCSSSKHVANDDENTSVAIYKSTILPHMDYADVLYDENSKESLKQLQLVQNKALRLAYNVRLGPNPKFNTTQLHTKAKLKPLKERRIIHLLQYAFHLKNIK